MPPGDRRTSEAHESLEMLSGELRSARGLAETAGAQVRSLLRERAELTQTLQRQSEQRRQTAAGVTAGRPDTKAPAAFEELRASELRLAAAIDELMRSNRRLDSLVEERAAALDQANAVLERMNAELSRRVDQEMAARSAAQAQLFQSQKLEAIGQLTGGIAHDFNNLLTVVTSGLQLLASTRDEAHRARLIKRIDEAAWRGADLTRRLLAFARRQPLSAEPLDIGRHVEGLRELLRHGLRDDIQIRTAMPVGLWPVQADLGALELALLNLAVNARDAMPQGGSMTLGGRNLPRSSLVPEQLGLPPDDYVELFVTDTGTGMSDAVLERVFEPFFTTKPAGQGTGLGLAQVYGFARQSGGTARVESRPGEGTTVAMMLPRAPHPPREVRQRTAVRRSAPSPEHLSVLVVEDDDEVAAMVLDMLQQLGHRGLRVSTLAASIAVLSGSQAVDLIFADVLLTGGGSGLDLAREVARRGLNLPLVLTSGYGGGMSGRLAAAKLPFLRKPYTLGALRDMLRQAVEPDPAALAT